MTELLGRFYSQPSVASRLVRGLSLVKNAKMGSFCLNEANNSNKLIGSRKDNGAAALLMQIGTKPIANKGGEDGRCRVAL